MAKNMEGACSIITWLDLSSKHLDLGGLWQLPFAPVPQAARCFGLVLWQVQISIIVCLRQLLGKLNLRLLYTKL